jgi:hypothetical protein
MPSKFKAFAVWIWSWNPFRRTPSFDQIVRNLTPQDLIENRDLAQSIYGPGGAGYLKQGTPDDNPLSSLYRLYHFIVTDDTIDLREELEFFFNKSEWAVKGIPDPRDTNSQRYLILAVMTALMVRAFNRLILKGLPRNAPPIVVDFEALAERPRIPEEVPAWALRVPSLDSPLKIPNQQGLFIEGLGDPTACKEFIDRGI